MKSSQRRTSLGRRCAAGAVALALALGGVPVAPALADEGIEPAEEPGIEQVIEQDDGQAEEPAAEQIVAEGGEGSGRESATTTATSTEQLVAQGDSTGTAVASDQTQWTTGTYTATGDITNSNRVNVSGEVTLVLEAGCKLTVPKGITVSEGNTLTIQGSGELVADLSTESDLLFGCAAIGGTYNSHNAGTISIEGGTVTATGGRYGAGIGGGISGTGGGDSGTGGTVTITGGTVTATGGDYGAGIGGGMSGDGGTVTITGGTVTATGGKYGAGIGGGGSGTGGTVTITGGTVTATGCELGAGIGAGAESNEGSTVTITGGTVTATGGNNTYQYYTYSGGAGIGAGGFYRSGGTGGTVTIDGGTVTIDGDAVVKAVGGKDTVGDNGVSDGIGVGAAAKALGTWTATLAIGSGRVLYGSESDIAIDVKDEDCLLTGATESWAGDRYQYMVVNGNKVAVSLSYATTSLAKSTDDAAFTNPLTNESGVAVTYESSNTKVATVDKSGKVTIKGAGSATITATYAGDDTHEAASASYELTAKSASAPTLACLAHLQGKGDVTATSGADSVVGTTGQSRRLEGMSLTLPDGTEGSIRYMVHTKNKGWSQGWVADGAYAGTRGQSRRAEAIRVELDGAVADDYDVWYRVHAQGYGWMGWAKNGAGAGTTGESRRIEAYEVVVLPKGSDAPGSTDTPFEGLTGDEGEAPTLSCLAHVQGKGDVTATSGASTVVGTTRQSRRMEGMSLALPDGTEGSVRYMVHSQGAGWSQGWVADGAYAGTSGKSLRAEAIRVELAGGLEDGYDVWYRVHAQGLGWMGWAKNGAGAGTTGQSRRIEAYEVVVLPKGCPAPGATANAFKGSL